MRRYVSLFSNSSLPPLPLYLHLVQLGHPHPLPVEVVSPGEVVISDVSLVHTENEAEELDCVDVLQVEHVEEDVAHCDLSDATSALSEAISLCMEAARALSFLYISAYVFMIPVVVSRVTRLRGIEVPLGNNHDHELMKSREIPTSSRMVE